MDVVHQPLPEARVDPQVEVVGHTLPAEDPNGTWLTSVALRTLTGWSHGITLTRDELAAMLKFTAFHDPDLYRRMGEAADKARRTS